MKIKYILYNGQDYSVLYNSVVRPVRVGTKLTCGKHLRDRIIILRRELWAHKTSLTPSLFIEVSVPREQGEWSCICV